MLPSARFDVSRYAETFAERRRGVPGQPYGQGFDLSERMFARGEARREGRRAPRGRAPGERRFAFAACEHASPPARDLLRKRRISYASISGELLLCIPNLLVDRAAVRRPPAIAGIARGSAGYPTPFARRSARIAQWLLFARGVKPTIGDLAAATV